MLCFSFIFEVSIFNFVEILDLFRYMKDETKYATDQKVILHQWSNMQFWMGASTVIFQQVMHTNSQCEVTGKNTYLYEIFQRFIELARKWNECRYTVFPLSYLCVSTLCTQFAPILDIHQKSKPLQSGSQQKVGNLLVVSSLQENSWLIIWRALKYM